MSADLIARLRTRADSTDSDEADDMREAADALEAQAAVIAEALAECAATEYLVPGKPETGSRYHEGRYDFADRITSILSRVPQGAAEHKHTPACSLPGATDCWPAADRRVTPEREQATALYAIVKEHGFDPMESRNLGYYRTEVTCFCGVTLWWGDHEGDPHYTETWNGHIVDALLASGVLDGTSKESAPDLTCPGDVSKPLPGVLGIPADQRDDRFDGPPRMYRGYPQAGHPPQFYGPDDVAVDGDWLAELEKTVSDQRTADRETISQALRKVYGYYAPVSALSAADAVLAVLIPADLIRAETLEVAATRLDREDRPGDGHAVWLRTRAAEYRKAAS